MINLNYLNTLFPNQPQIIETVISLAISEFPQFKRDFKRCTKNEDKHGLKKLAHKWQYTAMILGIDDIKHNLEKFRECEKFKAIQIAQLSSEVINQLEGVVKELHHLKSAA
ncbi:hypothetical protein N6H18_17375 [Reichenbachiella agarivorans]|uniref:HPt domain-containing protein n=1 Tax=Reichenbachiella agarivorans TaxID=2979464 RepID=A0ABY6CNL6_9BACT|nr:hypothetical protein [Reichenbachiella agarivorans]UXP32117.1 hypothetical protein N6H18_17375 [Reichenbachiella agarivorans]